MSDRVSAKQQRFLELVEVANRPVTIIEVMEEKRSLPHYVGNDFAYSWGFLSEGAATRWLQNLESRGFITIEKDTFVRITDSGRAAIAQQRGSGEGGQ